MHGATRSSCLLAFTLLLGTTLLAMPAAGAVQQPECAAIEKWAATIDKRDRWQPLTGSRSWLPRAFEGDQFTTLFGVTALEWSPDDTKAVGTHIQSCMKAATQSKRYEAQKALNQARGYITGSLKAILGQAQQQKALADSKQASPSPSAQRQTQRAAKDRSAVSQATALDEALTELLALPDSPELLRALGMLRVVDFADPESYGTTYGQIGLRPGRKLLQALRNLDTDTHDPRVAEKIEGRYQALRDSAVAEKQAEIAGLDASLSSLQALSRMLPALAEQLGPALTTEDRAALGITIAEKRAAIQQTIVTRAKELIDQAPESEEGIQRVDRIVANTGKAIVDAQQLGEVHRYAKARQQAIAESILNAATAKLDTFPTTLAGLRELRQFIGETRTLRPYSGAAALDRFTAAAAARMTAVARGALPEFKQEVAALPDSRTGLEAAEDHVKQARAMKQIDEDVRAAYVASADARRAAIDRAVTAEFEAARQNAIEAGGDPDIVGYSFVDPNTASKLDFRDEKLVIVAIVGLKFAGSYDVSRDDVIVQGPNGTMVLTKNGNKLVGMGFNFRRQAE